MKPALYAGLVLGLVPVQMTVLHHVSLGGIRPDLCLIASCLVGFLFGELEGMLLGLLLGFVQDFFSAGELWLNMVTKGTIGLLAGLAVRYLAYTTPMAILGTILGLSCLSGTVFLLAVRTGGGLAEAVLAVRSVLIPQAAFDAVLGAGLYWLIADRVRTAAGMEKSSSGLGL